MAASGPMVVSTHQGLEVKGRRRLADPSQFEALLEELTKNLEAANGETVKISDLDVSQNNLSYEQWESLFNLLGTHTTRVQRFRLFGCATMNDDVIRLLCDYLRMLNAETAPTEMHLSDCAITTEGWASFMDVIENTELYPYQIAPGRSGGPLYLRLENNYIAEESIKEKVDAGIVCAFKKNVGGKGGSASPGPDTKVKLVARNDNSFGQKQGEPPAPEDAAAPKQVWDKFSQQEAARQAPMAAWQAPAYGGMMGKGGYGGMMGKGGYGGMAGGGGGYGGMMGKGAPAAGRWAGQQALPAAQTQRIRPPAASILQRPIIPQNSAAGKGAAGAKGQFNAWQKTPAAGSVASALAGRAGGAVDRSRTPVARQPTAPPPKKAPSGMPHPWEEHWSEEYQIPYFWNSESGDSLWERPTA